MEKARGRPTKADPNAKEKMNELYERLKEQQKLIKELIDAEFLFKDNPYLVGQYREAVAATNAAHEKVMALHKAWQSSLRS